MNTRYISEPSLKFGQGQEICPKSGMYVFGPYDLEKLRPEKITVGIIGKAESIEKVVDWLKSCESYIGSKTDDPARRNLFLEFPGFNSKLAFRSQVVYDDSYLRAIKNSDFRKAISDDKGLDIRIKDVTELYLSEIKYLSKNKKPDVILCALTEKFMTQILTSENDDLDEDEDENSEKEERFKKKEQNFRRNLKALAMQYNVPIQIVRDRIGKPSSGMQDPATIAWNFFTALYYKASGTPWALIRRDFSETTCYAGISFYKSRDRSTTQTSLAQIFNESGNGVILRGEEVRTTRSDRTPHLTENQAYDLLSMSLREYYKSVKIYPKRLVLHKTSNFSDAEISGFEGASQDLNVSQIDLVTIMPSDIRLYRKNEYPPLRGTHLKLTESDHLLYTRGAVPYYGTYTGKYIPSPIQIRLFNCDESPNLICDEILALTKMNWNNTQFDRKFPITLECARNVGEILKYLGPDDLMQSKYSFYM